MTTMFLRQSDDPNADPALRAWALSIEAAQNEFNSSDGSDADEAAYDAACTAADAAYADAMKGAGII